MTQKGHNRCQKKSFFIFAFSDENYVTEVFREVEL